MPLSNSIVRFLKWENGIVGMIDADNAVKFICPEFNRVVSMYTRGGLYGLLNLDISETDVAGILDAAGFTGYRYDGALVWIIKTVELVKSLQ